MSAAEQPIASPPAAPAQGPDWWKRAVFYQIAPRSFQDTDGDGVGDLRGVIRRLDHLSWLGVDAVWLTPVFPTPNRDFGYDICDHAGVDPQLGTLGDLDELVGELHARGMRLLLDFVPNHTSDQHPWFRQSRSSREDPRRDWYVWMDPGPDGRPPNNWLSRFGGSAWEWDERTGQYYYHAFLKEQPDLNWRNPEVRAAMAQVLRFWLRRGVDGFRVDASAVLAEDELLRNDPPNPDADSAPPPERFKRVFSDNRPETLGYIEQIRAVLDEFEGRVLLAEVQTDDGQLSRFYGEPGRPRFHLPLNYKLLDIPWSSDSAAAELDRYLRELPEGAWPNWVLGSHDKPRAAARLGPRRAPQAAVLLFTLPGTPVFYAGDEYGMPDVDVSDRTVVDPFERRLPGWGLNRDPHRSPLRWEDGPKAGFTTGEPWLPMGQVPQGCNVAAQKADPGSLMQLYRRLIALKHEAPALQGAAYEPLRPQDGVLLFRRGEGRERLLTAANFTEESRTVRLDAPAVVRAGTRLEREGERARDALELGPCEAMVLASPGA